MVRSTSNGACTALANKDEMMTMRDRRTAAFGSFAAVLLLAACNSGGTEHGVPGDTSDNQPYAGIGEQEVLQFTGTEPFWGGKVRGGALIYTTLENQDGTEIAVDRFAGRNGLSFSGELDGEAFVMAVTPAACSDGMSDRTYPFVAILQIGEEQRQGCAWSRAHPFTGPEHP